ncbi:MAG TPA: polysaccharide biosynthesis C-terminal domain-containing protein [Chloroflexota bacterium]|nr:polysaccharide biosynthesis C-terminal domain-containing protein [Chloroflexota bacterium]
MNRVGALPVSPVLRATTALLRRAHSMSLLRNSVYIMATTATTSFLGFFYWMAAARGYPAHDVGLTSALITAMSLASSIANVGIPTAIIQVLPRRESRHAWSRTVNGALLTGTLSALLVGLAVAVGLPVLAHQFAVLQRSQIYFWSFVVSVPLMSLGTIIDNLFIAERSAGKMLVRNTFFGVLKLGLVIAFVVLGAPFFGIFLSWVLGLAAGALLAFAVLIPQLHRGYTLSIEGLGEMRSIVGPLAGNYVINLGYMIPFYLLPVAVTVRVSPTANAYFYTTYMLAGAAFLISPSVSSSLLAEGSYAEQSLMSQVRTSFLVIGALLIPVGLVLLLAGRQVLSFFGPLYSSHGFPLLVILVISTIPEAVTNVYMSVLRVRHLLRYGAVYNTVLATLILVFAWILLPHFGIVGVGMGWLIAQLLGTVVAAIHVLWDLSRRAKLRPAA